MFTSTRTRQEGLEQCSEELIWSLQRERPAFVQRLSAENDELILTQHPRAYRRWSIGLSVLRVSVVATNNRAIRAD
jgi:hypothetical protein